MEGSITLTIILKIQFHHKSYTLITTLLTDSLYRSGIIFLCLHHIKMMDNGYHFSDFIFKFSHWYIILALHYCSSVPPLLSQVHNRRWQLPLLLIALILSASWHLQYYKHSYYLLVDTYNIISTHITC